MRKTVSVTEHAFDEIYRLSYEPLLLGEYVRNSSLLYRAGRESVDELAETVGHYAHLTIEENGYAISIYESRGKKAVDYEYQATKLERRDPLHITASGKAILAFMPDERIEENVTRHGLDQWTERTITKKERLFEEIEKIRNKGVAYNDEEEIAGFRAVAAPIRTGDGNVVGSVSISGPTSFFNDKMFKEELPERIRNTANNIEVAINMTRKQSDIQRE